MNILPMSRVYHNRSFELLAPPHIRAQNQDMCHGSIGCDQIEIQSQPNQSFGTL